MKMQWFKVHSKTD